MIFVLKNTPPRKSSSYKLIKRCPTPNSTKVDHPGGGKVQKI